MRFGWLGPGAHAELARTPYVQALADVVVRRVGAGDHVALLGGDVADLAVLERAEERVGGEGFWGRWDVLGVVPTSLQ